MIEPITQRMSNRFRPIFGKTTPLFQLFIFFGLLLFGAILGMLIGLIILYICGLSSPGTSLDFASGNPASLQAARIMQLSSQLGLFIFPPIALAWLVDLNFMQFLGVRQPKKQLIYLPAIGLMFVSLPLIYRLLEFNQSIRLPESLAALETWMQQKETQAEELMKLFLSVDNFGGLLFNLFMIAFVTAIGEELVFRSVVQTLLVRLTKRQWAAVVLTSLIFSLAHFQFYGLLPRFVLGFFLGYFFVVSGSIFVPMAMHFVNNGAAVTVFYLHHNGYTATPMEELGKGMSQGYIVFSIILTGFLLWWALRISGEQ